MIINKIKILSWTVALLLCLNIATIATIVYHTHYSEDTELLLIEADTTPLNGHYFKQQMGFSNEQMQIFRVANRSFHQKANQIVSAIEEQKRLLFKELTTEKPDREQINKISARIGKEHQELKEITATFYLTLKEACSPEQKVKLENIFRPLFKNNTFQNCNPNKSCDRERETK